MTQHCLVKEYQSPNLFMRNGRMIMKISATVLELTEAYCDHCAIRIQTIAPFATTLELAIDEHIGAGFLAHDSHTTFQTGRALALDFDFDNPPRVNEFTVGQFSHAPPQ